MPHKIFVQLFGSHSHSHYHFHFIIIIIMIMIIINTIITIIITIIIVMIIVIIIVTIKGIHYKMEIVFKNTENSKTNEPRRIRLDLTDKPNLKNPKKILL